MCAKLWCRQRHNFFPKDHPRYSTYLKMVLVLKNAIDVSVVYIMVKQVRYQLKHRYLLSLSLNWITSLVRSFFFSSMGFKFVKGNRSIFHLIFV